MSPRLLPRLDTAVVRAHVSRREGGIIHTYRSIVPPQGATLLTPHLVAVPRHLVDKLAQLQRVVQLQSHLGRVDGVGDVAIASRLSEGRAAAAARRSAAAVIDMIDTTDGTPLTLAVGPSQ
jgi:hypothetical protein